MMLIDAIKPSNQNQLFRLTNVLWIDSKIYSLSVLDVIVDHRRCDDGELTGKIDVTRSVASYFADVDQILELLYDCEVHISHFLFDYIVLSLNGLKWVQNFISLYVVDHELFL